jgi:hypothetical protein
MKGTYSNVDLNRPFKSNDINGLGKLKSFVSLNKSVVSRGSAVAKPVSRTKENGMTTSNDPALLR